MFRKDPSRIDRHPFQLLAEVDILAIKELGTRVNDIVG